MLSVLLQCLAVALIGITTAEPPSSGYNYNRPSSFFPGGGGGGGVSFASSSSSSFSGGGNLISVSPGPSTNEGQYVEPQLLEKIRQLLLQEESSASAQGGGGGGGGGYPSSQYGAPSPQYGVPSYQTRVVGVDLEGVRQAIQVAQYQQTSVGAGGGGGGYPSGPSSSYAAPSVSFSSQARPSGSYGAPF